MPNQDIRLTSKCWPLDTAEPAGSVRCLLRYHAVVDQVAHDARPGGAIDSRNVSPSLL
jgi:hypothetical protein